MATKKETAKKTVKKSSNPVGRPRKKYGAETLMDNKKSFKVNNNNIVKTIDVNNLIFFILYSPL